VTDTIERLVASVQGAARQLFRAPMFAAVLIVTLGIGIASATAIFTVARGVLLRPLPFSQPEALVNIQEHKTGTRGGGEIAHANLERYRAARVFEGVTAFSYTELILSDTDQPERVIGAAIDSDFAPVIGARPSMGRGIEGSDGGATPARVAVISDGLWRRRYNRDTSVIGRSIPIDGEPYTVVGVMPSSFEFPRHRAMDRDVEVWVPRQPPSPMMERRGIRSLIAIARMKRNASPSEVQSELNVLATIGATENATINDGWRASAVPLRDAIVGAVRPTIVALASCVAVLMIIAWTNAAAAVLARLSMRRSAFEVRLALGASVSRIRGLIFGEAMIAALCALVVAVPLSVMLRTGLLRLAPVAIPRIAGITLDAQVIAFAVTLAVLSALFISIASTAWLSRLDSSRVLSNTQRTIMGSGGRTRAIGVFISVQIALGTVLLGTTSRMYASYSRLNRIDPGFTSENVTTATVPLRGMRYRDGRARSMFTGQLLERVRAMPGVEHAAVTNLLPLSGGLMSSPYEVEGQPADSSSVAALRAVSDDFFTTFGIRVEGRPVAATDNAASNSVVVVNRAFVLTSLAGLAPLGARIRLRPPGADSAQSFRIVGIAGDALERDLTSPPMPIIYLSDQQASFPHTVLAVKSRGPAPVSAIREALRQLDPSLALDDVATLSSRVRSTYSIQIFVLALLVMFAVGAATLVTVGIYGSVSFVVTAEMRGIGMRIALGATPMGMLLTVIGRVTACAAVGAGVGLLTVTVVPRALGLDPIVGTNSSAPLLGAAVILLLSAAASAIPARWASAADPISVLRS
jgi:putative ABC transport system permease protein